MTLHSDSDARVSAMAASIREARARLTDARQTFVVLAGPEFLWEHTDAPSQMNSAHRQGLTELLREACGDRCAACGDRFGSERVDLCHLTPSRLSGRGVMPGNAYVGHSASCNAYDARATVTGIVPIGSLVRPDLVPVTFPDRAACMARAKAIRATREARAMRRDASRAAHGE